MGISVNPPPQTKIPDKILNDDELRPFFLEQQEIMFKLWLRTGGGEDLVSGGGEDNVTSISVGAALRGKIFQLEQRVDCLEESDAGPIINSKIAQLNAKVDELIDELLTELKLLRPNDEREETKVGLQREQIRELKLLNERIEEGFNTGLTQEDIE